MFTKKFRFQIILRVLLLSATTGIFFYVIHKTSLLATSFIIVFLIIYQVYDIIRYTERTNTYLNRFLESIRHADFSQSFKMRDLGSSFAELNDNFNEVMREFQKVRREKEQNYQYLQTVVEHIGVGLIAFEPNGDVQVMNRAAKKILNSYQVKNIVTLSSLSPDLVQMLFQLKSGEKALVKFVEDEELLQLMVYATEFRMRDQAIKLVSLQNIQSELEEQEMEAWQKLISVLTHEIMNSVTPIASLSNTMSDILKECKNDKNFHENIDDIDQAIQTIHKRSEGLLHFVQAYRSLTRLPRPDFQIFQVAELFKNIQQLLVPEFGEKGISFNMSCDPVTLELTADQKLIEQVLINILKNATEAVDSTKNPVIELSASLDTRGRVNIQVRDNGPGISPEAQDKIFVPFYTTKKGGSGIGLSLSKQIMRIHKGKMSFQSEPEEGTVFKLIF